jgi:hypothetical protein
MTFVLERVVWEGIFRIACLRLGQRMHSLDVEMCKIGKPKVCRAIWPAGFSELVAGLQND